jgi:hypothetical protein
LLNQGTVPSPPAVSITTFSATTTAHWPVE